MTELTTYFKNELITQLQNVDWMDHLTKRRAIEKAECIEYKSGFPPYIFNETWMNENWGTVCSRILLCDIHFKDQLLE